jgi:hypothetical protein
VGSTEERAHPEEDGRRADALEPSDLEGLAVEDDDETEEEDGVARSRPASSSRRVEGPFVSPQICD